jgi:GDP-L-fucose synthase
MPTNLYGPFDNFDLDTSHVIPALIRKSVEAKKLKKKQMTIWGTGKPKREFLFVDDCADALVFLMQNYSSDSHINIGCGEDISIFKLAEKINSLVGFTGNIITNTQMPDGTLRKSLNVSKINELGWKSRVSLDQGLTETISWYKNNSNI